MRLRLLVAGAAALALLAAGCSSDPGSSDSGSSDTTTSEPAATQAAASQPASEPARTEAAADEPIASEPVSDEPPADNAGWTTGQDVLDALEVAGIVCNWTGDGDQIMDFNFMTGEASTTPAVRCDGFGVQLTGSRDAFIESVAGASECVPPTTEDLQGEVVNTEFVVGDGWVVFPDGEYPADAQPATFLDAFGGQTMTVLEVFVEACPDAVIPE